MSITDSEPISYNKAIIINCQKFHCPTKGFFGDSLENARLIEIYTIVIRSQFIVPELPFIWYHENALDETDCDNLAELIDKMQRGDEDSIKQFDGYKGDMLTNMVHAYFNRNVDTTPELDELMFVSGHNDMKINIELIAERYPQFYFRNWISEISNLPATFQFVIHLNHNETGLTVYNHFNNTTSMIPSKKGSLVIYPRSWMYPVKQTRIMVGMKYVVSGTISFYSKPKAAPLPAPEEFSYEKR